MGNVPNRWAGRGLALALGLVFAAGGFLLGQAAGSRLAFGFTFDWFVHPGGARFESGDVLVSVGVAAALVALVAAMLAVGLAALAARFWMRRLGYAPPRDPSPVSVDVLGGRLAIALPLGTALLAVLLGYVVLSLPMLQGGQAIAALSASGYALLVAWGCALAAGATALVAALATFSGFVSGKVVRKSDRNLIARVSLFGVRHAKATVAALLVVTMLAGYHASTLTTNVDVADVLPRGDPNTDAAHNLTAKFKSSFTQQVTFQFRAINTSNATQMRLFEQENREKLPDRVTTPDPGNITDELYVRAISEAIGFVVTQEPFKGSVGAPDFYKLINWTIAGGNGADDGAFSLPPPDAAGELGYASVEAGVRNVSTVFAAVDAVTSPTWRQTAVLVTVGPEYAGSTKSIGERAIEVKREWLDRVERDATEYEIFGPDNPPLFSVDLPLANAHASELTAHDFKLLLPIIAAFVAVTLFIAFRNAVSVVATFSMLAIAVAWTFGAMGALGIALNTLNLAVVPLIMGVGIDYGIHMMNEYQEKRAEGKTPEEAWIHAGGGSALALFVGMLTTAAGLVVMIVSPSLLVAQLGLLAAIALVSCYVLAIVFIPAIVTLMGDRGRRRRKVEYQPSRVMPTVAAGISRARWLVAVVVLLLAGAAVASAANLQREAFGDPPRNWLPGDALRNEHERAIQGFYDSPTDDVKANVIVIEGDVTDPRVHDYINALTGTLRRYNQTGWTNDTGARHESRIIADTLKDLPFLVNTYLTVKDGVPGAGQFLGAQALDDLFRDRNLSDPTGRTQTYPTTQEGVRQTLDEIFQSPLSQFANLFVDAPEYDMTVIVFSVRAATYEDAEAAWSEVQAALDETAALKPEGVQASFFGNTAINYLFVAKQVPWLGYMSVATNVIVVLMVLAFTRDLRATLVVGLLNGLMTTFWLGVLPLLDIGLAINLTMPLVFIYCVGSDYGLHLAMRCRATKNPYLAMEGVGKGVLFSFITVLGSFLIFTQLSDLAGRRAMIATAVAIGIAFVATLLIVPIFYPIRKHHLPGRGGGESRNVPVVDARPVGEAAADVVGDARSQAESSRARRDR